MYYTIGEISRQTGIAISTLRYYDKEGLFPNMGRSNGGIRVFSDAEIGTIKFIECLKTSGLSIKAIKQFQDWCQEGDSSLQERCDMFHERLAVLTEQMEDLQKTISAIKFKCWYYDTALEAGTEKVPQNMPTEEMPEEIQRYKRDLDEAIEKS